MKRAVGFVWLAGAYLATANTFSVSNTNQTGAGSLRQAILDANVTAGTNLIQFAITNPSPSITISNPLPDITNPVMIDGTTQPGFSNSPIVELNGANFGTDGLRINTSNSIIRGLVINRFTGAGISISAANRNTNNTLRGNSIFSNGGLGIDLGNTGIQPNDAGDPDVGANQLQNFPVLTAATNNGSSVTIAGSLNSKPSTQFTLDFYANVLFDASGAGEGQFYLGSTNVITGADSNATFTVTLPVGLTGRYVTATATDPFGNTSEFSTNVVARSIVPTNIFTVINTNDSGTGSLRQALIDANMSITVGPDLIAFAIPGAGPHVIVPSNALPPVADMTIIDGYTQSGAASNSLAVGDNAVLKIQIDGINAPNNVAGLSLWGGNNTVRGLGIVRFNGLFGHGIEVFSTNNVIVGNFIGVGLDGATDLGNSSGNGILITAGNNVVGGNTPAARNVISGNWGNGIEINGPNAINTLIRGNYIGTDASGTMALPNESHGVFITSNSRSNVVGGIFPGEANTIAFNGFSGISIGPSNICTNNALRCNTIFSNVKLGIDLGNDFVTQTNDAGDVDAGANFLQNCPALTAATNNGSSVTVVGSLNSAPNTQFALDFYASVLYDEPYVAGEGQFYLGSTNVTTGADSNANFSVTFPVGLIGRYICATATDPFGNTSEFGTNVIARSVSSPNTFTVINTNDSGPGSLRQALLDANLSLTAGPDRINFAIPGNGVHIIAPSNALPVIGDTVIIDGFTQPGSSSNSLALGNDAVWLVRLHSGDPYAPGAATIGLKFLSSENVVRGLIITRFNSSGIQLFNSHSNTIIGNCVGLDETSTSTGGGHGVSILYSSGNRIGGTAPSDRNTLSGTAQSGILVDGASSSDNLILGNHIGTDPTGTLDRGNGGGIQVRSPNTVIGGTAPGAGNLISGNNGEGIIITGPDATNNVVLGNFIGTDITGTYGLGNNLHGINVNGARFNFIGATNAGAGNRIAFNGRAGVNVEIDRGTNNAIRANSIFSNGTLGIDLEPAGVNPNDLADLDSGPNNRQNFPIITNAVLSVSNTLIQGTLDSTAGLFSLDFYASSIPDAASPNGEGEVYLGSTTLTPGNAAFSVNLPLTTTGGRWITATATDAYGNTSEFSPAFISSSTISPLSIVRTNGNQLLMFWPSSALAGFVLKTTTNLTPVVVWTTVTNVPSDNGVTKSVILNVEPQTPTRFFSLRQ